MVWSYSRITTFEDCPYRFFLKYIKLMPSVRKFFASYGSFMHGLLEHYAQGKLARAELLPYYLSHFLQAVPQKAPSSKVFANYFKQGADYLGGVLNLPAQMLASEKNYEFSIGSRRFVGIVDLVCDDGGLCIVDHKSHDLKPRSRRSKPTKQDTELDRYLRQLYLYSIPVEQEFGKTPSHLCFNCFRQQRFIQEPFREEQREKAISWALDTIDQIERTEEWAPNIEPFKCRHICDVEHCCEWAQLYGGGYF